MQFYSTRLLTKHIRTMNRSNMASVGDVVIVERSRFREGLYGIIEELLSSTSARVRTRHGTETQKLACLVPIVMQTENSNADSSFNRAQPENL